MHRADPRRDRPLLEAAAEAGLRVLRAADVKFEADVSYSGSSSYQCEVQSRAPGSQHDATVLTARSLRRMAKLSRRNGKR
jgi:hypothetical protein